jgi:hypothetical protein
MWRFKLVGLLLALLSSCTSPPPFGAKPGEVWNQKPAPVAEAPSPSPTPKKEPEFKWRCQALNGAGRIFVGLHADRYMAQRAALAPCERQYRGCSILSCKEIEEDPN